MNIWQKIEFAAICAVLSCAAGCASVKSALPGDTRIACYAQADHAAQARVNAECPPDAGVFATCPAHDAILAQLQRDQEACK